MQRHAVRWQYGGTCCVRAQDWRVSEANFEPCREKVPKPTFRVLPVSRLVRVNASALKRPNQFNASALKRPNQFACVRSWLLALWIVSGKRSCIRWVRPPVPACEWSLPDALLVVNRVFFRQWLPLAGYGFRIACLSWTLLEQTNPFCLSVVVQQASYPVITGRIVSPQNSSWGTQASPLPTSLLGRC